jgi:hypothetical protein
MTMTKRHLKAKFDNLIKEVATAKFYNEIDLSNRVNVYGCRNGHAVKTNDVDAGVTPFMIRCPVCGEMSRSSMYQPKETAKDVEISAEWYRPGFAELLKLYKKKPQQVEHVLSGGLLMRKL